MASLPLQPGAAPANPACVTFPDGGHATPSYRALSIGTLRMIGSINRACREHGIAVSCLGRRAIGDPRLFADLMNGRSLRPRTKARINRFIASLGEA